MEGLGAPADERPAGAAHRHTLLEVMWDVGTWRTGSSAAAVLRCCGAAVLRCCRAADVDGAWKNRRPEPSSGRCRRRARSKVADPAGRDSAGISRFSNVRRCDGPGALWTSRGARCVAKSRPPRAVTLRASADLPASEDAVVLVESPTSQAVTLWASADLPASQGGGVPGGIADPWVMSLRVPADFPACGGEAGWKGSRGAGRCGLAPRSRVARSPGWRAGRRPGPGW
jgi:hypothetical protein